MSLNSRIFSVPLTSIQKLNSENTLSSARLGRGFTGCGDINEEGIISISFNNFESLISTTPFKGSRSSLGSTGSTGISAQTQSPQAEPENSTSSESSKKIFPKPDRNSGSPGRRSLALRKKSHFSRYGKNRDSHSTIL